MKRTNTQSKLIIVLTAVILLLVALSSTLTFAYFTAQNNGSDAALQFGTMSFTDSQLSLTPDASDVHTSNVQASATNLVPGCTIEMNGGISIETTIAAFVRFQLQVEVTAPHGNTVGNEVVSTANHYVAVADADINIQANFAQVVFNKVWALIQTGGANAVTGGATWISYYAEDANQDPVAGAGYLYLDRVVEGDTDLITLDGLTINFEEAKFGNAWQGAEINIAIKADAIQAEHLTGVAADTVFTDLTVSTLAALPVWNYTTGVDPNPQP